MISARIITCSGSVSLTISASVRSPNISALAYAAGWNGSGSITCTVNAGVDVATLVIAGIPSDCLTIINRGRIGGVFNGGTAIYTRVRIRIDNAGGTVFGGGGQGGVGGSWLIQNPSSASYRAEGPGGYGGQGAGFTASGAVLMNNATSGGSGGSQTLSGPSVGGLGTSYGGSGGSGGAIGNGGGSGNAGSATGNYTLVQTYPAGSGQNAGYYADGASLIQWLAAGSRLGNVAN